MILNCKINLEKLFKQINVGYRKSKRIIKKTKICDIRKAKNSIV